MGMWGAPGQVTAPPSISFPIYERALTAELAKLLESVWKALDKSKASNHLGPRRFIYPPAERKIHLPNCVSDGPEPLHSFTSPLYQCRRDAKALFRWSCILHPLQKRNAERRQWKTQSAIDSRVKRKLPSVNNKNWYLELCPHTAED